VFIDYVLKQFEYLEQKRTSQSSADSDDNGGANVLAKSYLFDLYENFDSESSISDPLNPFDLDTMLNKLCSSLHGSQSSTLGVGASNSSRSMHATGMISSSSSSSNSYGSSSPIISSLNLKQHEHQRNFILIPKLFDFLILLSHEKKMSSQPKTIQQGKSGNGLLTVPEVMQLCDNLIASENS
jgi:hypothetical protein